MPILDDELDQITNQLLGVEGIYKNPVNVSGSGKPLDAFEPPTIIGGFFPRGKYLNETHKQGHPAIDFQAPKGTSCYAIGPGTVSNISNEGSNPKGGNAVWIKHDQDPGLVSYYSHFDKVSVSVGQKVDQSTVIGTIGNSGTARYTSAHVHLGTKINGADINPSQVIGKAFGTVVKKASSLEELENLIKLANTLLQ